MADGSGQIFQTHRTGEEADANRCLLNRKPYRDKDGKKRVRVKCCGRRDAKGGCTLTKQPDGVIVPEHRSV